MKNKGNVVIEPSVVTKEAFENLYSKYTQLKTQYDQLLRQIFGTKSERFIGPTDDNQLNLFGESSVENEATQDTIEITYKRHAGKKVKEKPILVALPSHLDSVEEIVEPLDIKEITILKI